MTLVYRVTGCELADSEPAPAQPLRVYDSNGPGDPLPDGVVKLDGDPSIETASYVVHLKVSSDDFDPGSYSGLVEIRADWLNTVRTAVTISRSENRISVPLLWGALGAVAGLVVFVLPHWLRKDGPQVSRARLAVVVALGIIAGTLSAFVGNYINQDIWTASANWWATAVIGFTGATSGVMAALWGVVWPSNQQQPAGTGNGGGAT
jgi:hypothetical protein